MTIGCVPQINSAPRLHVAKPASKECSPSEPSGYESLTLSETSSHGEVDVAQKASQRQLDVIAKHVVEKVSSELLALPAAGLMFHGSSARFDSVECRPNQRVNADESVKWSGSAIFAAMDPRVALHYTADRPSGFGAGIDLIQPTAPNQPLAFYLHGGENLDEALTALYGNPADPESCMGYIHLLDKTSFVTEPGLGTMEMVTRDPSANLGRLSLNRREAIDDLVQSGDVVLRWKP